MAQKLSTGFVCLCRSYYAWRLLLGIPIVCIGSAISVVLIPALLGLVLQFLNLTEANAFFASLDLLVVSVLFAAFIGAMVSLVASPIGTVVWMLIYQHFKPNWQKDRRLALGTTVATAFIGAISVAALWWMVLGRSEADNALAVLLVTSAAFAVAAIWGVLLTLLFLRGLPEPHVGGAA